MAEEWQGKVFCPLTWTANGAPLVPMTMAMARSIEAEGLDFSPTPWHRLLELIGLAYAYHQLSRADACEKVINCYAIILPGVHDSDCPLIKEYRPAIRHLLDGFWAMLEWERRRKTSPLLAAFIEEITPFEELSPRLQAAVHAVHATISKVQRDVALTHAQLAVQKSPGEGEWHHLLGLCTGLPGSGATPAEHEAHLREAHRLRPGPHTAVTLARVLASKEKGRARELLDEALREHPDSPYVLSLAGEVLVAIDGLNVETATQAKRLLERCSSLIGDRGSTELKLANLCRRQGGREAEAKAHYQKVLVLLHESHFEDGDGIKAY
ncbi:uncharacterized protein LOC117645858 isoform X2 [Thrips palmi]|uniref:Uncharacterized protein LOC117645858 isoform X2 n=1 Tax=Thrips palmi TaxID=161013 RepID=A0A6P8YXD1_THRPL|nr:uncharacterized protein LOC117645858 isoform X2 [Thrips palmi]